MTNRGREQSTKRTRNSSREEDGGSNAEFIPLVPAGQIIIDAREQSSLCHAEEKPGSHHTLEVVRQTHGDHCDAPDDHDARNEDARSKALQEDVGEGFEEGIGDEEDGEAGIVLTAGDVETFLEAIQLRVADIGSIEKGDEIEQAEPRDQAEIEFPEEFAILDVDINT